MCIRDRFYSLYGFLLEPETIAGILGLEKQQRYKVNILAGWISPLNHATYPGHTFGYDDLPSVFQSGALFLALDVYKRQPWGCAARLLPEQDAGSGL